MQTHQLWAVHSGWIALGYQKPTHRSNFATSELRAAPDLMENAFNDMMTHQKDLIETCQMKHSYKIISEDNLVLNTIAGALTFQEYRALMDNIMNDEQFVPSMNMFWDFREGTLTEFSNDDIAKIRSYVMNNQERRGDSYRVAFLVNKIIDYGLSRMYQIVSEDLPVNFQVFYEEQEAMDWIKATS